MNIPKIIFIVPYRNRETHKIFFSNYMSINLKEKEDYEIYYSFQSDNKPFNRGASKNIGFLAMRHKYPLHYKEITFVFNDIDTIPYKYIFDYETSKGIIKHFYGFDYALGGIVSILGSDFESINGFPNYWGWGMEDALLQKRCEKKNLLINRSNFFALGSPEILHLFDGVSRIINKKETLQSKNENGQDGLTTLFKVKYYIENEINNKNCFIIKILEFQCLTNPEKEKFYDYDLREPKNKILYTERLNKINNINKWTNIPFYPTNDQKKEMVNKFGLQKTNEIIKNNLL
jgi:hypothetical protein